MIETLTRTEASVADLGQLLIDATAHGTGVGFLHPLARDKAEAHWRKAFAAAERGERVILGLREQSRIVGTVTLVVGLPENQPHRAEVQKVLVAVEHRRRGLGARLMCEVESLAARLGKSLLVLDAVPFGDGAKLYDRLGWNRAGEIPDFALLPDGTRTPTRFYWKRV
ncbi:MAG TPA: GNAT family N-acetyltransferase [Myxococcota bacterium]|nr:GNAT family N-acetyltransferase [Myxococcota bacterium]